LQTNLTQALLIGAGGFLGALFRFGLGGWAHRLLPNLAFPVGTLLVNLLGCLLIGILSGLGQARQVFSPEFRLFAFIGLLGGFTTFSTFGLETFAMLRDGEQMRAAMNVGLNVLPGLLLVWLGYSLAAAR